MKSHRFLLQLLLCALFSGQTQFLRAQDPAHSRPFYVYRNDGGFDAFLTGEVSVMYPSRTDTEGKEHAYFCMQIVETADSIHRIPLSAIDSISFVTPETRLNPAVFPLTVEHIPYLLQADTLAFLLKPDTPDNLKPAKGNIVTASYDCTTFPHGIMARVTDKEETPEGTAYSCEPVSLDEVYDQVLYYGSCVEENPPTTFAAPTEKRDIDWASPDLILWDQMENHTWETGGTTTTLTAYDRTSARLTFRKLEKHPVYFRLDLQRNSGMDMQFNAVSSFSQTPDPVQILSIPCGRIRMPGPLGLFLWVQPQLKLYGYFEEEGNVSLDFSGHVAMSDRFSLIYDQKHWNGYCVPSLDYGMDVATLSMSGSAEVGLQPEIRFALNGSPSAIGLTSRFGLKESVDFLFDAKEYWNTGFYDASCNSYARTTAPMHVSAFAQAGLIEKDAVRWESPALWQNEPQVIPDRYLLPLFSNFRHEEDEEEPGRVFVSVEASRDLLWASNVGMVLYDKDGQQVSSLLTQEHRSGTTPVQTLFTGLTPGETYTAYPLVSMMGATFQASPSYSFTVNDDNVPTPGQLIDLGLSVKWAGWNVGASAPEEYGGYYASGETEEKSSYTEHDWLYWNKEMTGSLFSFDVAHVKWGGKWRMPSPDEMHELLECTRKRITYNGIKGLLLRGPNGNTIFLPAGGVRTERQVIGSNPSYYQEGLYDIGEEGYYRTLTSDWRGDPYSIVYFFEFNIYDWDWGWFADFSTAGVLVRPVSE